MIWQKLLSNTEELVSLSYEMNVLLYQTDEIVSGPHETGCQQPWYGPTLIAMFMGPTRGPSGADRTQVGPILAP